MPSRASGTFHKSMLLTMVENANLGVPAPIETSESLDTGAGGQASGPPSICQSPLESVTIQ
jgi:hypothetical protein